MRSSSRGIALLIGFVAMSTAWAQSDQVNPIKGAPARGKVQSVSSSEVVLRTTAGSTRRYPVNEIRKVSFGADPRELSRTRDLILRGRVSEANAIISKLDPSSGSSAIIKRDIEFYQAFAAARVALTGGGDRNSAAAKLKKFIDTHAKKTHHFFAATEVFGDLLVADKKYSEAAAKYKVLGTAPWPDFKLRAGVLEAGALVAEGKYADAQKKYGEIAVGSASSAQALAQKNLARVGGAICLAELGKAPEGIKVVQDVIRKNDATDKVLFAKAYNALGRCYQRANKSEDALLAYLKVHLLFFNDADAHAESLYHLSKLWRKLNKSDRAVRARSLLRTKYAGSLWATKE